jgi:transcriptional regulator with XRE-family HTH domain
MARAALGWSIADLASHSGVAPRTIMRVEAGEPVRLEKAEAIRAALVKGGAMFVEVGGRVGVTVKDGR